MFLSTTQMAVKTNQTWTLYKTNGCPDESNMNSLQKKWQSRRVKHERVHVWFVLTAICVVESSHLIRLDCHLFCRVHVWFVLTVISFVESSCNGCQDEWNMNSLQNKWLSRRIKHELSTKQMAVKTNQTWTLYTTNGCHDEESSCLIRLDSHLFCREFMFDSSWLPFVL
jgi:hypothetical protein